MKQQYISSKYRKHSRKEKKYGNDICEEQQEQYNNNNNYDELENCNGTPNDAEESEEESYHFKI